MVATSRARLRRACDRTSPLVATRFARLRRACDRTSPLVATRFARLRRACDRHWPYRTPGGMPYTWAIGSVSSTRRSVTIACR